MDDPDPDIDDVDVRGERSQSRKAAAHSCGCCGDTDGDAFQTHVTRLRLEHESTLLTPNGDASILDVELPEALQQALRRFLGGTTVETLGDWVTVVRQRAGGGPIELADLCHEDEPTGHWGQLDGERYHFTCFFDAVVLAALTDRRVAIRTESPDGSVIEATATGHGDLSVSPPGTLVSFGVVTTPEATGDGDPTHEDVYESVCPVVKAFPNPHAYETWAQTVSASTVAMPLAAATELAAALVE